MADPGRIGRCAALLAWLEREGCEHAVHLGETPGAGGVGVFASRDIQHGEILISCPTRTVISAAETRLDFDDAMIEFRNAMDDLRVRDWSGSTPESDDARDPEGDPLDDSTRMQLVLLRERHIAETQSVTEHAVLERNERETRALRNGSRRFAGYWSPYVLSLPGDELVASLPMTWSEDDLERRLLGTSLLTEVRAEKAKLRALSRVLERDRKVFPPVAFGRDRLEWAHCVFWSRAIDLRLPGWGRAGNESGDGKRRKRSGGDDGALVPFLDMCNHASGIEAGTEVGSRGDRWRLIARRTFRKGEEVRIDYGAKGNGELLRRHGFVVPGNAFDTCPFPIQATEALEFPNASSRKEVLKKETKRVKTYLLHRGVGEWREFPFGLREDLRRLREEEPGDGDGRGGSCSSPRETDLGVLETIARIAKGAAAEVLGSEEDWATRDVSGGCDEAFAEDGFTTCARVLADRACSLYRASQIMLLRDLSDLADEGIREIKMSGVVDG
jgi:hypothetical protein